MSNPRGQTKDGTLIKFLGYDTKDPATWTSQSIGDQCFKENKYLSKGMICLWLSLTGEEMKKVERVIET
jgi:hypothetical protein